MLSAVTVNKFVSYDKYTIPKNILKENFIMIILVLYIRIKYTDKR